MRSGLAEQRHNFSQEKIDAVFFVGSGKNLNESENLKQKLSLAHATILLNNGVMNKSDEEHALNQVHEAEADIMAGRVYKWDLKKLLKKFLST